MLEIKIKILEIFAVGLESKYSPLGLGSRNVDSTANAGGKFHEVKRGAGWQGRS